MKKLLLTVLNLAAFGLIQTQATVYYINDNTVEPGSICTAVGNIANNGLTPATPKTLEFVNHGNSIHPGDTVYIDKGDYINIWNCGAGINPGTAAQPVRFIGVDSSSTRIIGTAGVGGTNAIALACMGADTDLYWEFSSLALVGQGGMPALYVGNGGRSFRFVTFTDCVIKSEGMGANAINLGASMAKFRFENCRIQSEQSSISMIPGAANIENSFINCHIVHVGNSAHTVIAIGNGTRHDNVFDGCTITNNGPGPIFEFPGGNYNNTIITNSRIGSAGTTSEGVRINSGSALIGFQFSNNYVYGVQTGISCGNPGQGGLQIVNNSFYTTGNSLGNANPGGFFVSANITNNIFASTATSGSLVLLNGTNAPATMNYNLYYKSAGANLVTNDGTNYATLEDWKGVLGANDDNSLEGNPVYADAAAGDLAIACTSPAFQTGTVVGSITEDIDGNTRPATPSIGAYENTTVVTVSVLADDEALCAGGSTAITASGADTYTWAPATGLDATTGTSVTASPEAGITYTITGTQAGCTGTTTITIVVNPLPVVTLSNFDEVCDTDAQIALTGGAPAGGDYSGTGVTANSFDAAIAGQGTHEITYIYTDANGCEASATADIIVTVCTDTRKAYTAGATSVYPNPSNGSFMLKIEPKRSGNAVLMILDAQGKSHYTNEFYLPAGESYKDVEATLLPGVYHLQLVYEGKVHNEKLVVQ
jgi:hypothetical protein